MTGSDARELATILGGLNDDELAGLFDERAVPANPTWADSYDAAEALLDPLSVARSLAQVPAAEAGALRDAARSGAPVATDLRHDLQRRGLVSTAGRPFQSVAEAIAAVSPSAAAEEPGTPESEESAAERAFEALASVADILNVVAVTPLSRIGTGALAAPERRRLVDDGAVATVEDAEAFVNLAAAAGLLAPVDRQWHLTTAGEEWSRSATTERWFRVAEALLAAVPAVLQSGDDAVLRPAAEWDDAFPFDPQWPRTRARLRDQLARWTVIGADGEVTAWGRGLASGDRSTLTAALPAEIDRVYLQNDLTAIAPGPLEPHLDQRLRSMAVRETRAQASTYRFTADSIGGALRDGETADSIREFLTALSLTGVPQPLGYEIDRAASRHGRLRVGLDRSGRTAIRSEDAALLDMVAVDQALRPLGLIPDGGTLLTRGSADTALWMLVDARYPAVAVDEHSQIIPMRRASLAEPPAESAAIDIYAPLIARLRQDTGADADSAWLGRELDRAVKERATIEVVVHLRDGSERTFTLEATGFGGGRLRGRDRGADIERTLPLSSIVRVGRSGDE